MPRWLSKLSRLQTLPNVAKRNISKQASKGGLPILYPCREFRTEKCAWIPRNESCRKCPLLKNDTSILSPLIPKGFGMEINIRDGATNPYSPSPHPPLLEVNVLQKQIIKV